MGYLRIKLWVIPQLATSINGLKLISTFTEPRYYYDAIKHSIQMHLLAQESCTTRLGEQGADSEQASMEAAHGI